MAYKSIYPSINNAQKNGRIKMEEVYLLPYFDIWFDTYLEDAPKLYELEAVDIFDIWKGGVRTGLDLGY